MVYSHPVPHHLPVDPPQYVDVVVVNKAFEAPSLEEYLQANFPDYLHRRFRKAKRQ